MADAPDAKRLHAAMREARDEAAPFALAGAAILIALAVVSKHANWQLLGHGLWWMWLAVAVRMFSSSRHCSSA